MNKDKLITNLNKIKKLVDESLATLSTYRSPQQKTAQTEERQKNTILNDYILTIVNKIKNCEESEKIEKQVLDKNAIDGRVLLPFFICYKYFPHQGLTTGDVEKITSELRVKIKTPNVSKAIAESLQKYLDGNSTRARGKPVVYKLNRKGGKYFESILNQNEKE